jgi:hypothetical protein
MCAYAHVLAPAADVLRHLEPVTMSRHALLVLADPGNGGAALASALVRAGAWPGHDLVPTAAGIPCECAPLAALNERLLAALGLRRDSPVPLPDRWQERPAVRALAAEGDSLVADQFGGCARAVVYGAGLALTARFWLDRFVSAGFDTGAVLLVHRLPEASPQGPADGASASVAPEKAPMLRLEHLAEAERATRGLARALVACDDLFDEPAPTLARIAAEARFPLLPDDAARGAALSQIRADGGGTGPQTSFAGLQGDVRRIAQALADIPARERALADELVSLQRELSDERVTIARLTDSLERERENGAAMGRRAAEAEARLGGLLADLDDARAAEQQWHEHHRAQAREIDHAMAALDAAVTERDALRAQLDAAQREIGRQKAELESLRADLRIVDHDRGALAARAQAVDAAAAALRNELARRAGAEAALLAERDRMAAEAIAQAEQIVALERDLARRHSEVASLSSRHEGLARIVSALEATWFGRRALSAARSTGH